MGRKWANIVAKKTAKDGANSKVYAKFGVEIYVAAKKGEPDPESNSALKFVIERAKQAQVPKHVIDKALDKAKGNTDETFTEGRYEGFGPNGSADAVFEQLLEADVDVDDVEAEDGTITVYTAPTDLHKALRVLRDSDISEFQVTELEMIPQSEVELTGEDLETFEKLYSVLEDDEDVQKIYTNVDGF